MRAGMRDLLEDAGHSVSLAASGEEGIERLQGENVDLIFTDMKMPGMSGIEVIREARILRPGTPIVMVTGYATVDTAIEAMKLGAFDYLQKPFRSNRIREILEEVRRIETRGRLSSQVPIPPQEGDLYEEAIHYLPEQQILILCIDPTTPGIVACVAKGARVIDLSGGGGLPPPLYQLRVEARQFLQQDPGGVLVVEDLAALHTPPDWSIIRRFIEEILEVVLETDGHLVVGNDPRVWTEEELKDLNSLLSYQFFRLVSGSIASPIRRRIIRFLGNRGSTGFHAIHDHVGLSDTPKLSFHLRKLIREDILIKDSDKTYTLTNMGQRIDRSLQGLEAEGARSSEAVSLYIRPNQGLRTQVR